MKEYRDNDRENESNDEYSDTVLDVRNRKIIIIDGDSESDSDALQDSNNLEWIICEESSEIPLRIKFIDSQKPAEPQVSSNVEQPMDFFLDIFCRQNNRSNNS